MRERRTRWVAALAALVVLSVPAQAQTGGGEASICGPAPSVVEPTPSITAAEICSTIAVLAADSMEGRAAGTAGGERAAAYLARRFAALGLEAPDGSYLQPFRFSAALLRDPHAARTTAEGDSTIATANVVAILRGSDPELADQAVVVGAHYDHLGWGGMGSLSDERAIHNGADDNASGIAGLLELAEHFRDDPPRRTIVFVGFGAEELGALGSIHYLRSPAWPADRTVAMVNLDMIGRLRETLTVQGTGSSPAWPALIDSLSSLPGAPAIARVPDGSGPSDHAPFYDARIPVLFLFTGAHDEYHRPGDDVALIDAVGEVRVLELAAAAVEAVADADAAIAFSEAPVTQRQTAAFRVALGIIPDYGFAGPGVRIASVRPGGPAERAGFRADDVLLGLAGRTVDDVYVYTEVLSELEAGEPIEALVKRGDDTLHLTVAPESR